MGTPVVIPYIPAGDFYVRHQFPETWAGFPSLLVNHEHRQRWCSRAGTVPAEKVQDGPHCLVGKICMFAYQFFNQVPVTDAVTTGARLVRMSQVGPTNSRKGRPSRGIGASFRGMAGEVTHPILFEKDRERHDLEPDCGFPCWLCPSLWRS